MLQLPLQQPHTWPPAATANAAADVHPRATATTEAAATARERV